MVRLFSLRKSIQNWRPPSFLRTKTTALHQGDWDGHIAPPSSISWMCSHTSSTNGGAICQNHSLKGSVSNNSITCSAVSVHPISFSSKEKILWCSINIHSNLRANSRGHCFSLSSQPSFLSNSSSNFCLSSIVNFFGGFQLSSGSSSFLKNWGREQHLGWRSQPLPLPPVSQQPNALVCP